MTCGESVIEWLYSEQLKVDAEWSVRTDRGFIWWAHEHAQTIEVVGEETGPDGEIGYLIAVRTDALRNISDGLAAKVALNELAGFATMSGPVFDEEAGTVELCSLVRVHPGIAHWIQKLISIAAVLQLVEAESLAARVAGTLVADAATSDHPHSGWRSEPDEILETFSALVCPLGEEPSRWESGEFTRACECYMQASPALMASSGGRGISVEFPFGHSSSLCQFQGEIVHPLVGNGLAIRQCFPISIDDESGASLAMLMNRRELLNGPFGYGFGAYHYANNLLQFLTFLPNLAYQSGLLPNLYFSCAGRAWELSETLAGETSPNATHATEEMLSGILEVLDADVNDSE
jgi:hypothetical protein